MGPPLDEGSRDLTRRFEVVDGRWVPFPESRDGPQVIERPCGCWVVFSSLCERHCGGPDGGLRGEPLEQARERRTRLHRSPSDRQARGCRCLDVSAVAVSKDSSFGM